MKTHTSYDLEMNQDLSWSLYTSGSLAKTSNLAHIIKEMTISYGFSKSSIREALDEMQKLGQVRAHFGTGRTFLFSLDIRVEDEQKVS